MTEAPLPQGADEDQVWGHDAETRVHELAVEALKSYDTTAMSVAGLDLLNLSENATFKVSWDGCPSTILRLHRANYNSPFEIDCELTWVDALRRDGIKTPQVLPTSTGLQRGELVSADAGELHSFAMFELCPGAEPSEKDMAGAMQRLGTINAAMHEQARNWDRPNGFTRRTWDVHTMLGPRGHWGDWQAGAPMSATERRLLGSAVERLTAALSEYGMSPDRFGLVHADLRLANLLVDGDDTYVIDFDDCGFSWFLYDGATSITFLEEQDQAAEWLNAWAHGYEHVVPLTADDKKIMPSLVMLRRLLVLAWLGSHAQTPVAREESEQYLEGTCGLADRYVTGAMDWL